MNDTITVYEKCEHGRLEPHGVGWHWEGHEHTVGCKPPVSEAKNGYHWSDGCPGGKTITLPAFLANGVKDYSYELGPAECGWDYDRETGEDTFPIEMYRVWVNGDPAEYREVSDE